MEKHGCIRVCVGVCKSDCSWDPDNRMGLTVWPNFHNWDIPNNYINNRFCMQQYHCNIRVNELFTWVHTHKCNIVCVGVCVFTVSLFCVPFFEGSTTTNFVEFVTKYPSSSSTSSNEDRPVECNSRIYMFATSHLQFFTRSSLTRHSRWMDGCHAVDT